MTNGPERFEKRITIGVKLASIPLIFILSISAMMAYIIMAQQQQRDYTYVMSLIVRQRTLTQFYVKDVLLAALKQPKPYAYWRDVFIEHSDILAHGGMALAQLRSTLTGVENRKRVEISPAPTEELSESLADQRALMEKMVSLEKAIFSTPTSDPSFFKLYSQFNNLGDELNEAGRVSIENYTSYAQNQIDEMIRNVILLGLGVAALCLFLNWLISKGISQPLLQLAQRAEIVSGGKLNNEPLPIKSQDEVGQLTWIFNRMNENLREMAEQNVTSVRELSTSSAEILASTQQQSASTQEQVSALQETNATMEEVRQSGAQISDRAREVSQVASENLNLTEAGLKSVQQTVNAMLVIGSQVNQVAENIVSLSEKNRAVGDIVALVSHIAEQSNLLALNAAIEAAAAGEQGRSFAVVANEMKHLSDQARDATHQVKRILEDIQKGISRAVMLTEEAVKKVDDGRQQTDISESTIRSLTETTQQSIQAFQQIVAATNQQQLGLEQIFLALQDIRLSAEQTAVGTHQLNKACNSLNAISHQLQQLGSRYIL